MDIVIDQKSQGERIDKFTELKLKDLGFKQATRSMIKDDINKGCTVNGQEIKPSYKLKMEDEVHIDENYWKHFFEHQNLSEDIVAQKGDLEIIYEDDYLIVLNKPKGMVVHPGVGNRKNTLANYLKEYLQSKNQFDQNMDRAGIVHRLDKGVSGLLVTAKSKEVQDALKKQFAKREVEKIYLAKVEKYKSSEITSINEKETDQVLEEINQKGFDKSGWFEAKGYVGRDLVNRYKMQFKLYQFRGSKPAKSYILPVKDNQLLIKIVTGRMHQIRATLYYYGFYIIGDDLYKPGKRQKSSDKIMLKSIYLSFNHPVTKEKLSFLKT
jgi:23S rRNA pseudouridine1911/1915/1917 synthase